MRRLVANGNGNGNGGSAGVGGGAGVGSAAVGGRASPAGSVSGASGAPRPPKACFKCGSLTHLASECPYRATPQQRKEMVSKGVGLMLDLCDAGTLE